MRLWFCALIAASTLIGLDASGPAPEYAEKMMLFGQLVGDWELDYVAYLDINELTLFERGSVNQMYRGRANITVTLVDVSKPDDMQSGQIYSCTFPSDNRGPVPVAIDMQPMQFRQMFLTHVARQLSWYFSNYPRADNRMMEPVF